MEGLYLVLAAIVGFGWVSIKILSMKPSEPRIYESLYDWRKKQGLGNVDDN